MTRLPIEVYGLNIHKHFLPLVVTLGFSAINIGSSHFKASKRDLKNQSVTSR